MPGGWVTLSFIRESAAEPNDAAAATAAGWLASYSQGTIALVAAVVRQRGRGIFIIRQRNHAPSGRGSLFVMCLAPRWIKK